MSEKRRRSQRQSINLEQLKNEPDSFLSWGIEDPTLRKLETYRLYQAGYAVADIAAAFGLSAGYLYEMWGKFKAAGQGAEAGTRRQRSGGRVWVGAEYGLPVVERAWVAGSAPGVSGFKRP